MFKLNKQYFVDVSIFQHCLDKRPQSFLINSLINCKSIICNQTLFQQTSKMNIIQLLYFFNLLNNYLSPNAKYLLVQVNDEETKNDLDAPKKPFLQSRNSRIIGGSEIRKHSEPWLALLCYDNVREGG